MPMVVMAPLSIYRALGYHEESARGILKICHGEGHQDEIGPAVLCTDVPHLLLLMALVCPDGLLGLTCYWCVYTRGQPQDGLGG